MVGGLSAAGLSSRQGEAISFHLDKWGNTDSQVATGTLGALANYAAQVKDKVKTLYVALVHEVRLEVRSGAARTRT